MRHNKDKVSTKEVSLNTEHAARARVAARTGFFFFLFFAFSCRGETGEEKSKKLLRLNKTLLTNDGSELIMKKKKKSYKQRKVLRSKSTAPVSSVLISDP